MKKVIGYILFVASFIAWAAIAILPLLNLSVEMVAAVTTILIVGAEVAFILSIALLGKEFLEKLKIFFVSCLQKNKIYSLISACEFCYRLDLLVNSLVT